MTPKHKTPQNTKTLALAQLAWFTRLYNFVMYYRNRIHTYLDQWAAYQRIKQRIVALVSAIKSAFKRKA